MRFVLRVMLWLWAGWAGPGLMAAELPVNNRLGGDFQLQSTVQDKAGLQAFRGKVVLLNFGFTQCPDVCPMVLTRMARVLDALGDRRSAVQPLFVSFDPERDTLARLQEYLAYFGKDFIGMTGTPEQVAQVTKQYGVVYLPQKSASAAGTLFAHGDHIYLLDQQGRVRALFSRSESIDNMVDAIESLF